MHKPYHSEATRQQLLDFVTELSPEAEALSIRAGGLLLRVAHAVYQSNEGNLAEAKLSFAQYRLLMDMLFSERFQECEGMNPSTISERQGVSRNTISALIRNLEEQGLVQRQLDASDRRRFIIELTPKARELVREHANRHFKAMSDLFSVLTDAEKETLIGLLEKLGSHPRLDVTGV